MFSRTRLHLALAVLAGASLGGCSIYTDSSSDNLIDPDATGQCVRDTIAQCYLDQLPADDCAELVLATCDLDEPTVPGDPQCFDELLRDCLAAGGDPMTCELRASEACSDPGPGGDCFDRVFEECMAMYADPQVCTANADQICYGTGCGPADPSCPPPCPPGDPNCTGDPDCFDRVFRDCVAQGGDPMTCSDQAAQVCSPQPCASGDPSCPPPPCMPGEPNCPPPCDPADPTCGGPSCTEQVFRDCLSQGIDPMTCAQLAAEACDDPTTPCQPGDPSCPPPCDPADPMCQPPPPPPCDPADPMCSYP